MFDRRAYQREWSRKNIEKTRTRTREWYRAKKAADPEAYKAKRKAYWPKVKYGITDEQRNQLFINQGLKCAICMTPTAKWQIDHCHVTSKVRGILCHQCNALLGFAKDNPAVLLLAVEYIDHHKEGANNMVQTQQIDIRKRVAQYVELRDKIKKIENEHKEALEPYKAALDRLNEVLLQHLNDINSDSASTDIGTVYRTAKASASLADASAFMDFVIEHRMWDLLDRKANVTAVQDYIRENEGELPPGVNFNKRYVAGVRRK
jgi:hypothetical protein